MKLGVNLFLGLLTLCTLFAAVEGAAQAEEVAKFPSGYFQCERVLSHDQSLQLMQLMQASYAKLSSLSSPFVQESISASLGISEVSQGVARFQKPGRMSWQYEAPNKQLFLVRDQTVWFYQADEKQVLIDRFQEVLLSELPVAFLLGVGNLTRDFVLISGCSTAAGAKSQDEVIMLHLRERKKAKVDGESSQGMESFKLLTDTTSKLPLGVEVVDLGGNTTRILLRKLEQNPELTDKIFEPDFPRGIDLIDRRPKE